MDVITVARVLLYQMISEHSTNICSDLKMKNFSGPGFWAALSSETAFFCLGLKSWFGNGRTV